MDGVEAVPPERSRMDTHPGTEPEELVLPLADAGSGDGVFEVHGAESFFKALGLFCSAAPCIDLPGVIDCFGIVRRKRERLGLG